MNRIEQLYAQGTRGKLTTISLISCCLLISALLVEITLAGTLLLKYKFENKPVDILKSRYFIYHLLDDPADIASRYIPENLRENYSGTAYNKLIGEAYFHSDTLLGYRLRKNITQLQPDLSYVATNAQGFVVTHADNRKCAVSAHIGQPSPVC